MVLFKTKQMKLYIKTTLTALLLIASKFLVAQPQNDGIFSNSVKSIEVYKSGNPLNNPVIALLSNETIDIHFDMLDNDIYDFRYEITLCDRNWNKSSLHTSEYLQQFGNLNFEQIDLSVNTNVNYVHYSATFPNENLKIRYSGNYILQVINNETNEVLFQKRIIVAEQLIKIEAAVQRSHQVQFLDEYQEIQLTLFPLGFPIRNPFSDISVQVLQNHRWDNMKIAKKPSHITGNEIRYWQTPELLFFGNAEFNQFNFKSFVYPGGVVRTINYNPQQKLYNVVLQANENRSYKAYSKTGDLNGKFTISHDFVNEANTLADYAEVIFTYNQQQSLYNDYEIYVVGEFSMWQPMHDFKMNYNSELQQYKTSILLKQGYYDYALAYYNSQTKQLLSNEIDGSYYQTENDYEIFVYFYDQSATYDRLIAYQKLNTANNDN